MYCRYILSLCIHSKNHESTHSEDLISLANNWITETKNINFQVVITSIQFSSTPVQCIVKVQGHFSSILIFSQNKSAPLTDDGKVVGGIQII